MESNIRCCFSLNFDCSVFVVSSPEKITIFQHVNQQVVVLVESQVEETFSCVTISMDGGVVASAVRDQLTVYLLNKKKVR